MKRNSLFAAALLLVLVMPALALAGGTWSKIMVTETYGAIEMTVSFTADAADASIDDLVISGAALQVFANKAVPFYLYRVTTDPAATAPTDDYDLYIYNSEGIDMAGGKALNRDETNTEVAKMAYFEHMDGKMTLHVANNAVNSGSARIVLKFVP